MKQSLQQMNADRRAQEWSQRIANCRSSGISVREWCCREGLSEKTYYYWQHKLYQMMSEERSFVELPVEQPAPVGEIIASVQCGSIRADIHAGADEAAIKALLRAMKSC